MKPEDSDEFIEIPGVAGSRSNEQYSEWMAMVHEVEAQIARGEKDYNPTWTGVRR